MGDENDRNIQDTLDTCGCCEGLGELTPVAIENRPGLSALAYRVGTYGRFKAAMQDALSRQSGLERLKTRENDDFSLALMDAWAVTSDVLTFYQERIVNEGYLRTAVERFSILELARLIGYELAPGVAADTYLAFTIEDAPGALGQALNTDAAAPGTPIEPSPPIPVDIGVKVQSIPGPGETAQTFETIEKIAARPEWNAIKPRLTQPHKIDVDMPGIFLKGTAANFKPGDTVLIAEATQKKARKIMKITIDNKADTTRIDFVENPPQPLQIYEKDFKGDPGTGVYALRKRAFAFGYNAPKLVSYEGETPKPPSDWSEWLLNETAGIIYLDNAYEEILPNSYIALQKPGKPIEEAVIYKVLQVDAGARTEYGLSSKTTRLTLSPHEQWWDSASIASLASPVLPVSPVSPVSTVGGGIFTPLKFIFLSDDLSAIRGIVFHVQSEPLDTAEVPIEEVVSGAEITLNGLYPDLKNGQMMILTGKQEGAEGAYVSEKRVIKEVIHDGSFTIITLDKALTYSYQRGTVTINANVALATHGESVTEILGSGDASQAFQQFILRQPPLTYISAATSNGIRSTLEVRVNDLLWNEVPSFYDHGPDERIYITRLNNEGKTTVQFGDGVTGSRVPSGQENITAAYRKGIGLGGTVKAGQLSMLLTKPLGVKGVTNPFASAGADDPEKLEQARQNAPLTVLTLDRIVSLKDFADFANAFTGIAKARADWVWVGETRLVYVTVAGANGQKVAADSTLYKNLQTSVENSGSGCQPFYIESYVPFQFNIKAGIKIDPDYIKEKVMAQVKTTLEQEYSFERRNLGQPVTRSEVIAVIQGVAGVTAVDLEELYIVDTTGTTGTAGPVLNSYLPARVARWDKGLNGPAPAELLTVNPPGIIITSMEIIA